MIVELPAARLALIMREYEHLQAAVEEAVAMLMPQMQQASQMQPPPSPLMQPPLQMQPPPQMQPSPQMAPETSEVGSKFRWGVDVRPQGVEPPAAPFLSAGAPLSL